MSMDERMTICNMSIEGGARVGYVNPDATTEAYIEGREFRAGRRRVPARGHSGGARSPSAPDASYDDVVTMDGADIPPMVTWGINPGQVTGVDDVVPSLEALDGPWPRSRRGGAGAHGPRARTPRGRHSHRRGVSSGRAPTPGSATCTRPRAWPGAGVSPMASRHWSLPGSQRIRAEAEAAGLHEIFQEAGFEWREAGCSMCLAMNPDKLQGDQVCASSSNRNFKGRQGSPTGRTLLMSPAMVAAAALAGEVADVRRMVAS